MNITLHKRASVTPTVRREIQRSKLSERKLSEKYGISRNTVRKWKYRDTAGDLSHRPHNRACDAHCAIDIDHNPFALQAVRLIHDNLTDYTTI